MGCQDRLIMADNSPFGAGVVRLGDTEIASIDGTKIYLSDVERTAASQGLIEVGSPLTPGQPIFQKVLDELIDQRLWRSMHCAVLLIKRMKRAAAYQWRENVF